MNYEYGEEPKVVLDIREAADKLIDKVGYEKLTVRQLCEEAGVTTGAFYYYFDSKEDLLFDRYRRTAQLYKQLRPEILAIKSTEERLLKVLESYADILYSRVFTLLLAYIQTKLVEYQNWQARHPHGIRQLVEEILADDESLSVKQRYELSHAIWYMLNGMETTYLLSKGEIVKEDLMLIVTKSLRGYMKSI